MQLDSTRVNALVPAGALIPKDLAEVVQVSTELAKSGYFSDARAASQAVAKVLAGRELGVPPVAAMTGIFVIPGPSGARIMLGANLLAGLIKRTGRYNFRILVCDVTRCRLAFTEKGPDGAWGPAGPDIEITLEQARALGWTVSNNGKPKANWESFPDDMLFARCLTKGQRRYFPDVTLGMAVYTPDELDQAEGTSRPTLSRADEAALDEVWKTGKPAQPAGDQGTVVDAEFQVVPDGRVGPGDVSENTGDTVTAALKDAVDTALLTGNPAHLAAAVAAPVPADVQAVPAPQGPPAGQPGDAATVPAGNGTGNGTGKPPKVTDEQAQEIQRLIAETASDAKKFCAHFGIKTVRQLTQPQYEQARNLLQQKKNDTVNH